MKRFMVSFLYIYTCTVLFNNILVQYELSWFMPYVYHNGRTHSFSFGFGSGTKHMLWNLWYVFLNIYTSTVFLTEFWCNELTWFVPHVYHNGRTHFFSFEFGSETENMLKNLWYVFLYVYLCTLLFNKLVQWTYLVHPSCVS